VLLANDPELAHVTATWRVTARGHNTVYSGNCELIRGRLVDLTDYVRKVLLPADDD
jgi:hypothetical protein